jgi:hypothetical protein
MQRTLNWHFDDDDDINLFNLAANHPNSDPNPQPNPVNQIANDAHSYDNNGGSYDDSKRSDINISDNSRWIYS